MASLEASKIRDRVLGYCVGFGIDVGCKDDKIRPEAMGIDKDGYGCVNHRGDAMSLPFQDGTCDYVFSSHCLEDIGDTAAALREWVRVLRVGGNIILYVPHPDLYKGVNLDHKYPGFKPEFLAGLLVMAGCEIVVSEVDDGDGRYSTLMVGRKLR